MESVTDCWLCRLVIDLSGERCFSQAATVLWKPQGRGEEIQIKRWRRARKFVKKKKNLYWMRGDARQKEGAIIIVGIILSTVSVIRAHSRSLNSMLRQVATAACSDLWISDQRGERHGDEYKLETACCDRFASAGRALLWEGRGKRGRTSILQPILFKR